MRHGSWVAVVLVSFTLVLSAATVSGAGPLTVRVLSDGTGDNVNIRSDPSMDALVIEQVRPGTSLPLSGMDVVTSADGLRWVSVSRGFGIVGYVRADLVSTPGTETSSTTTRMTVATWSSAYDYTITTLANDLFRIHDATVIESWPAMLTACQTLNSDLGPALATPPIPDVDAERHWRGALFDLSKAADDCSAASVFQDFTMLKSATTWFDLASLEFKGMASAIHRYT